MFNLSCFRPVEDDLIIIRCDGGISSQILFYALGLFFEEQGFRVKYDLSWYRASGKDDNGVHARNFDLTRCFPDAKISKASRREKKSYQKKYKSDTEDIHTISPPAYLPKYYYRWPLFIERRELFRRLLKPDDLNLDDFCEKTAEDIGQQAHSCAVHVRRGDLATYNEVYGHVLGEDYFIEAVNRILGINPGTVFYFFSDEMDWVKENIIPLLAPDVRFECVVGNGSDKGYLDLYLMSKCTSFIASKGSLSKLARVFASDTAPIVECASLSFFKGGLSENAVQLEEN